MTQTLLLIGSGGNLGQAVARRFGREGWRVALAARNRERLEAQAKDLTSQGIEAEVHPVDASDAAAVGRLVEAVEARSGAIDSLVYNAAAVKKGALLEIAPETIAKDLMANVGGAMAAARAAAPGMLTRGGGSMIFTGGGLAVDPWPDYVALAAGKFALNGFVQCLALDQGLKPIHFAHVIVAAHISPEVGETLAETYWTLHGEAPDARRTEVFYKA